MDGVTEGDLTASGDVNYYKFLGEFTDLAERGLRNALAEKEDVSVCPCISGERADRFADALNQLKGIFKNIVFWAPEVRGQWFWHGRNNNGGILKVLFCFDKDGEVESEEACAIYNRLAEATRQACDARSEEKTKI